MNHRHTDFQSVAEKSQASNKQELTKPTESSVQTSVQTNSENGQKQDKQALPELSQDIAEIVTVWPELPEYIKAAIKALVQTNIQGE